ncbi:MAG: hypothetical protein JW755_13355 [Candidatus Aminicenantes bacterium]|nr:hypothetical protein [Candidatus Aminicenantes bacterium]
MGRFMEIKCLEDDQQKEISEKIEKNISRKLKEGIFSKKEIRDIEEMRLQPLPDIQDVQSVYKELEFIEEKPED